MLEKKGSKQTKHPTSPHIQVLYHSIKKKTILWVHIHHTRYSHIEKVWIMCVCEAILLPSVGPYIQVPFDLEKSVPPPTQVRYQVSEFLFVVQVHIDLLSLHSVSYHIQVTSYGSSLLWPFWSHFGPKFEPKIEKKKKKQHITWSQGHTQSLA